jgi:Regulator of chromosome condensation (RCC1) repeat/IPT/TIG domain
MWGKFCRPARGLTAGVGALAIVFCFAGSAFATSGATSWGDNEQGQLGNGTTTSNDVAEPVAGLVQGVTAISAGSLHSLALLGSGGVLAWGDNESGELGNGTKTGPQTCASSFTTVACGTTPAAVSGLGKARAVAAGGGFSLALVARGEVRSWGSNFAGALGDGGDEASSLPVTVKGLKGVKAISADGTHALALLGNGKVMAWGNNEFGQLGDGTHTGPETCPSAGFSTVPCSRVPVPVTGLSGVVAISAGDDHNLALLENGTVMAWGVNNDGQLGDNSTEESDVPVSVSGLSGVAAVSAGGFHSLALLSGGTVMAWGDNGNGQLGTGTAQNSLVPTEVPGLGEVTTISAGLAHSLAVRKDGSVMAWGWNENSQLGIGLSHGESTVPLPVMGLAGVRMISAGGLHSLADSPPPTVAKITPKEGPVSGGTSVTLTGTFFSGATAVKFGTTNAQSFTINSDSSITAVSPAGSGRVDVTVTTPDGTSQVSARDRFKYVP